MTFAVINETKTFLSSSRDGSIKAWNINGDALVFNQSFTDGLKACYQTTGQDIEILFLNT